MSVVNYYAKLPKKFNKKYHNPNFKKHGIRIPFRALIIGASGSGKTNVLIDMIHKFDGTFNTIVICVRSKEEPLYQYLGEKCPNIIFIEGIEDIPQVDEFEEAGQSLIVFDDLVLEKDQSRIAEYFIRGRKIGGGISCVYITQSYFKVPKVIRINCNYILIKKLGQKRELRRILDEFSLDLDMKELTQLYNKYTKNSLDFFMIDIENSDLKKKYRHNYGETPSRKAKPRSTPTKSVDRVGKNWTYGGYLW